MPGYAASLRNHRFARIGPAIGVEVLHHLQVRGCEADTGRQAHGDRIARRRVAGVGQQVTDGECSAGCERHALAGREGQSLERATVALTVFDLRLTDSPEA